MVNITIMFLGTLGKSAGKEILRVQVPRNRDDATREIKRLVEERVGTSMLYGLLLNGRSILLDSGGDETKDGDAYSIVPVILGG